MSGPDEWRGLTVADVMLRHPKALPSSSTVGDVRAMLGNPSVQMVLLADDGHFRGAITALPDEAPADDEAFGYADERPESIRPTEPASAGSAPRPDAHPLLRARLAPSDHVRQPSATELGSVTVRCRRR